MRTLFRLVFILFSAIFLIYLARPIPTFPSPPEDSTQSTEPADSETEKRRAYFTDYSRDQVIDHYKKQVAQNNLTLRLNYPPEDAQTLIRDQTRSVYLEELVEPLRFSLFINGFEPRVAKDDIWYKGRHYNAKITIRYVETALAKRLIIGLGSLIALYVLGEFWINFIYQIRNNKNE
jgi:hypothetical protein